ncbi:MAG: tRNA (N6-isopentenyl adenosine(37)-C2)-methylthiotransferase MiaB, partial [Clostridioides sp.]|nr:tRNA (N6-isopentenyl adenosine(37)-C2)-methylthiotransferase MiaB [Clostridioides sp.]
MSNRKQVNLSIEKIQEQDRYIEAIHRINESYFNETGKRKKVYLATFGCQMNEHDSEKLFAMLEEMGYDRAINSFESDLVIYNTCAVRENAELKVYGNLGQLKHEKQKNKDMK